MFLSANRRIVTARRGKCCLFGATVSDKSDNKLIMIVSVSSDWGKKPSFLILVSAKAMTESEVRLGTNTTETRLKELCEQGRLGDYAIVHFASHGAPTGQVQG